MKDKKKPKRIGNRITDIILLIVIVLFCVWQDNSLTVTNQIYSNSKIPEAFNGYKIVQVSDLHNKQFGKDNNRLINAIEKEKPDIIIITGDIVDRFRTNESVAIEFVKQAVEIAPVYYVSGNHESWLDDYNSFFQELSDAGATITDNKVMVLSKQDDSIDLIGLKSFEFKDSISLNELMKDSQSEFNIVLSHHPDLFSTYIQNDAELVFCGHAHGGQFRLPFIGAVYAPDQGLFPKYTEGLYVGGETTMCVSRGLGNSVFPIRLFNRPEIVVMTLQK